MSIFHTNVYCEWLGLNVLCFIVAKVKNYICLSAIKVKNYTCLSVTKGKNYTCFMYGLIYESSAEVYFTGN